MQYSLTNQKSHARNYQLPSSKKNQALIHQLLRRLQPRIHHPFDAKGTSFLL